MISKFIVIAICVSFTFAGKDHHMEKFREESDKCMNEMGIDKNELEAYLKTRPLVIGEGNKRCFFRCLLQGMGFMDDDGNLIENPNTDGFPEEFIQFAAECRATVTGNDACERAFSFHKCIVEKKEAH